MGACDCVIRFRQGFVSPACGQVAEKRERRAREAAKRLAEELKDEARVALQAAARPHASSSGRAPAPVYLSSVASGAPLQVSSHW